MTMQEITRRQPTRTVGFKSIFARINAALAARRQRRALEKLDDAMLRDIGITRAEALNESRRRTWDVPAHWRC